MTRIDFYLIEHDDAEIGALFACHLVEKIALLKKKIYIQAQNQKQAEIIDNLLWTYKENSFLPHDICTTDQDQSSSPILIGFYEQSTPNHGEVLINTTTDEPFFFSQFERLAEIVLSKNQDHVTQSRIRYKKYRIRGYPLHIHRLRWQNNRFITTTNQPQTDKQ